MAAKLPTIGSSFLERTLGKESPKDTRNKFDIIKSSFIERTIGKEPKKGSSGGKLGMAGKAISKGIKSGSNVGNVPSPTMEKPETVSKVTNPTIATISSQLDTLVDTANKIGLLTREQQEALANQITQANRIAKEDQLEKNIQSAIPESIESAGTGDALTPLGDAIDSLASKIEDLIYIIDDKIDEGDSGGDDHTVSGKGRKGKVSRKKAKFTKNLASEQLLDKNGNMLRGAAKQSRIDKLFKESQAVSKTSLFSRLTKSVGRALGGDAIKAAGTAISTSPVTAKIASLIGTGIKSAAGSKIATRVMEKSALAVIIKKAAGPLIEKGIGGLVAKSIPIIGAAAGVGFAVNRLLQGDVVGAGLDLVSGLGGPLTAIPAFVASVARDVYSDVFGIQPEQDPEFGNRMGMVKDAVEALVKEYLDRSVKPKTPPTNQPAPAAAPSIPSKTPASEGVQPKTPAAPPASPPPSASSGGGGSGAGASGQGASTKISPESPSASTGKQIQTAEKVAAPTTTVGEFINAQSVPVSNEWESYGYDSDQGMFVPQSGSTTRGSAEGIGRIPDPVYRATNVEDIKSTLYFNY